MLILILNKSINIIIIIYCHSSIFLRFKNYWSLAREGVYGVRRNADAMETKDAFTANLGG